MKWQSLWCSDFASRRWSSCQIFEFEQRNRGTPQTSRWPCNLQLHLRQPTRPACSFHLCLHRNKQTQVKPMPGCLCSASVKPAPARLETHGVQSFGGIRGNMSCTCLGCPSCLLGNVCSNTSSRHEKKNPMLPDRIASSCNLFMAPDKPRRGLARISKPKGWPEPFQTKPFRKYAWT